MEPFEKILLPFDGSEHALRALLQAGYLASISGAQLDLLHVIDLNKRISSFEQVSTGGYVPGEMKEAGYRKLAETQKKVPEGVRTEIIVEIGSPTEIIIDTCQKGQYDLIVMGSRGLGKVKQFIMGSVSQYVLYHAPCPVMVVRDRKGDAREL